MPRKKRPDAPDPDAGAWRVILEDLRAQIGVFGDALNASIRDLRVEIIDRFQASDVRLTAVEHAVRQNSVDIRQNSLDIRNLSTRVEKLEGVEERVAALEQRRV